ncbi:class I tRNA ligase family protein [Actinosynnema sp. CS-041913]|uniref:class I tRNA ligase family protein n=1 Tax=Actinosynnema sp. CS-041913 TaxID=3239917 RepID=UPI003D8D8054
MEEFKRTVVISPAPTANGDLHVGHLAGPFLAADVCVRFARSLNREALLATGMHFTQNYVVTTAKRLGVDPEELRLRSADEVSRTLAALGIDIDAFGCVDDRFVKMVVNFYDRLRAKDKLVLKSVKLPYSSATGEFLTDSYVRGTCPFCLAENCAGLCESCAHPILPGDLIDPRSTLDPDDPVTYREARVLVFPVEDYRAELEEYFARQRPRMRPRMALLIDKLLSEPLVDAIITQPITWGIPAPFPDTTGQVVYADLEGMPWSMYCTALAAEAHGAVLSADDELWLAGSGTRVVYFLGTDAVYPFAVVGTAMLIALGDYVLADQWVSNEFYELSNEKFSTSRGHVISGRDLVAEVPRDLVRFHLSVTGPEFQRTDFTREALDRITTLRLVDPWNRVVDKVDEWVGQGPFPVSAASRAVGYRIFERFRDDFDLAHFSLTHAAHTITEQLARLDRRQVTAEDVGDFCYEVEVFLRCAAPILIDLAAEALPDTVLAEPEGATQYTPIKLPRLTGVGG